ncbi:hypothetical protein VTL71DRAFT_285 [Oculimacula yallundae]|uniref:Uncharacterized protein n=1 Tax=Oculimacula yallundae TaxID=86028 RepID=A0ABR4CZL9_9HELO
MTNLEESSSMELYLSQPGFEDPTLSRAYNDQVHPAIMAIEESGSITIREYSPISSMNGFRPAGFRRADDKQHTGYITAQYRVSAATMIENSDVFKAAFLGNDWLYSRKSYIDVQCPDLGPHIRPLEIVLKALHEDYPTKANLILNPQGREVCRTLVALKIPKSKLIYWFYNWISSPP